MQQRARKIAFLVSRVSTLPFRLLNAQYARKERIVRRRQQCARTVLLALLIPKRENHRANHVLQARIPSIMAARYAPTVRRAGAKLLRGKHHA